VKTSYAESLRPLFIASLIVAGLELAWSPSLLRSWWPGNWVRLPDGVYFVVFLVLALIWIAILASALIRCGRRGSWLLIGAPLGLLPLWLWLGLVWACAVHRDCL
jgi:hypothetical protein